MRRNIERALAAKRESRRVEFKPAFDAASEHDWSDVIRDIVAMANSGGGVILFGVNRRGEPTGSPPRLTAAQIAERLQSLIQSPFSDFQVIESIRDNTPIMAVAVGDAQTPLVFSDGTSERGRVYFRHGAKSVPGTTDDLAALIDRRMTALRKSWLSAVKRVVENPPPPTIAPDAPIRVVNDPNALAVHVIDYDKTHPYRQKELLAEFRRRAPQFPINQFDLLAIRHKHGIDDRPDFSHKPVFGSRQYSQEFVDWLVDRANTDATFFETARVHLKSERAHNRP